MRWLPGRSNLGQERNDPSEELSLRSFLIRHLSHKWSFWFELVGTTINMLNRWVHPYFDLLGVTLWGVAFYHRENQLDKARVAFVLAKDALESPDFILQLLSADLNFKPTE